MARRITTLAREFNKIEGVSAVVRKSSTSGDRKIKGSRLRWPGKTRYGNKIEVTHTATKQLIFSHNSSEAYRRNSEVEEFLALLLDAVRLGVGIPEEYADWHWRREVNAARSEG